MISVIMLRNKQMAIPIEYLIILLCIFYYLF